MWDDFLTIIGAIAIIAGALGWIGGYFKTSNNLNLNKEEN